MPSKIDPDALPGGSILEHNSSIGDLSRPTTIDTLSQHNRNLPRDPALEERLVRICLIIYDGEHTQQALPADVLLVLITLMTIDCPLSLLIVPLEHTRRVDTSTSPLLHENTPFSKLEAAKISDLMATILELKSEHRYWETFQLENGGRQIRDHGSVPLCSRRLIQVSNVPSVHY